MKNNASITAIPFDRQHAIVGIYTESLINDDVPTGHALAVGVTAFRSFLRPLGQVLTEETVREVICRKEDSVWKELDSVFGNATTAAKKLYQLVSFFLTHDGKLLSV